MRNFAPELSDGGQPAPVRDLALFASAYTAVIRTLYQRATNMRKLYRKSGLRSMIPGSHASELCIGEEV